MGTSLYSAIAAILSEGLIAACRLKNPEKFIYSIFKRPAFTCNESIGQGKPAFKLFKSFGFIKL